MSKKIKILHLEDEAAYMDIVKRILNNGEILSDILVVGNKEAYIRALLEFAPDVILSAHTLPSFNSGDALQIFLQSGMKIPFILVTASISEEYAASVIKAGASDYVLKDHLEKLPGVIMKCLERIELELDLENRNAQKMKDKTNAVLIAQEHERNQMANELLENINQILAASNLYLDRAIIDEDQRMAFMQNSKKYILMGIDEIKKLSHIITPSSMGEIGLIESLNNWIEFKQETNEIKFIKRWANFDEAGLNENLQLTIYRIVQEQLNNIIKHSNAGNVYVSLEQTEETILLVIRDDGVGFDTSKTTGGVGLQNIITRAEIHNGKMLLESPPGMGCTLSVFFHL